MSHKISEKTRDEIRQEWIEALRSGDYLQGEFKLAQIVRGKVRHCCLGVACEILHDRGLLSKKLVDDYDEFVFGDDEHRATLPLSAVQLLNMIRYSGHCVSENYNDRLAHLNDEGVSFKKIADMLESGAYWKENTAE